MLKRLSSVLLLALVAVSAFAAGASADDSVSSNWAGYAVADPDLITNGFSDTPVTYTSVTGTWTEPKAACSTGSASYSSFWVGLGGYSEASGALEQTGTSADCSDSGKPQYYAWYELVPAAAVPVKLAVKPGDVLSASVNVTGTSVLIQIKDRTRKTAFTKRLTMADPDLSSAEWIAEAPSGCADDSGNCRVLPLANFGTVTFSRIAAIGNAHGGTITDPTWASALIRLIPALDRFRTGSVAGATPTTVSADGRTFAVSYDATAAA